MTKEEGWDLVSDMAANGVTDDLYYVICGINKIMDRQKETTVYSHVKGEYVVAPDERLK